MRLISNLAVLVDGGYMDNTPIQPLRENGIRDIIVVDVGSVDDTSPRDYGDSVSGWWIFFNRFEFKSTTYEPANVMSSGLIHFTKGGSYR